MIGFLAHTLFVLAAWTLTIKFAFPIAWALSEGAPLLRYVWWDFWWVAHIWLALTLLARPAYTLRLALAIATVEIIIVVSKFTIFLQAPNWDIWTTNWFINKLFVLATFSIMLIHIVARPDAYRAKSVASGSIE